MQCHDSSSNIRLNSIRHHKKTFSVWIKTIWGENCFFPIHKTFDSGKFIRWILFRFFYRQKCALLKFMNSDNSFLFCYALMPKKKQFYHDKNFFYLLWLFLNIFPRKNFILSNFCGTKNWKYSVRSED